MRDRNPFAAEQLKFLMDQGSLSGDTDVMLLARFLRGTGKQADMAFETLVARHGPMVLKVCHSVLDDPHDALDAFQATFLVLILRGGTVRTPDSLAAWLHGAALRVSKSARRLRSKRRIHERQSAMVTPLFHDSRADAETREMLHEALGRLPDRYRLPLVLCDLEGHTYESAATQLGWPIGTIKSRLSRGRDRLRARLVRCGIGPEGMQTAMATGTGSLSHRVEGLGGKTVRLAHEFVSGKCAASGIPGPVGVLVRGTVGGFSSMKASAVAALSGGVVAAGTILGVLGYSLAAQHDGRARVPLTETSFVTEADDEPSRQLPPIQARPRPWETAVRLRIWNTRERSSVGFCSGVIVHSEETSTLVATCAHNFRLPGGHAWPQANDADASIRVDLFDGKLVNKDQGCSVTSTKESLDGELVDVDYESDVAVVRIRPRRTLMMSKIAPTNRVLKIDDPLITVGCSEGRDATAWQTSVTNPKARAVVGKSSYEAIECRHAPLQGRSGGGLFTPDGELVGICNYADSQRDRGYYAPASLIQRWLDRYARREPKPADPEQPSDMQSLYVPTIQIEGLTRDESLQLTEAIKKQLEGPRRMRIVEEASTANATLEFRGEIKKRNKPSK